MKSIEDYIEESRKQWEVIRAKDEAAKAAGKLVGRYVCYSIADGAAYYEVKSIKGNTVTLEHIAVDDAWRYPMIEDMDCQLPLKVVEKNISGRDWMSGLFNKKA